MILLADDRLDLRLDRRSRNRASQIKYTCRQPNVGPSHFFGIGKSLEGGSRWEGTMAAAMLQPITAAD